MYNVNGVNGRFLVLFCWLEEMQLDVVCLQELKVFDEKFLKWEIECFGYECIWYGQKSWNGVVFLLKGYEMSEIGCGFFGDLEDVQSCYMEVLIGGIVMVGIYLFNGNLVFGLKFDYKFCWFEWF